MNIKKTLLPILIFLTINLADECLALDIDDDIEIDDSVDGYHDLGKIQKNINYIVRNAISKSCTSASDDELYDKNTNFSSIDSVILGTGSKVNGDIVIIDKSGGNKIAVSK